MTINVQFNMRSCLFWARVFFLQFSVLPHCSGEVQVEPQHKSLLSIDDYQIAKFKISHILSNQDSIIVGSLSVQGRYEEFEEEKVQKHEEVRFQIEFDRSRDLLRYRHFGAQGECQLVKNLEEILVCPTGKALAGKPFVSLHRHPLDTNYNQFHITCRPFDYRVLGVGVIWHVKGLIPYDSIEKSLLAAQGSITEFTKQDGLSQIVCHPLDKNGKQFKLTFIFDDLQSSMPISILEDHYSPEGNLEYRYKTETKWKEIDNVAVPIRWTSTDSSPEFPKSTATFDIQWSNVNSPLHLENFEITGFDLPDNTRLVSHHQKQDPHAPGKVDGWLGQTDAVKLNNTGDSPTFHENSFINKFRFAIIMNLSFLILLLGWLIVRSRFKRTNG